MRICIVGPGALGCLHAALLARAGADVCLLDHRPERAALIRERGVTVEDESGSWTASVPCSDDASALPPPDCLLLCVKTFQTGPALAHAAGALGPETVVASIQNGLVDPECLVDAASPERVVLGTSRNAANTLGPGHVRHAGSGATFLGPLAPDGMPAADRVAEALRVAFAEVRVVDDIATYLWRKLFVNVALNPLTALTGLRNGQLVRVPLLLAAIRDLTREAERVALAREVDTKPGLAMRAALDACKHTAENRSSMLQDAQANRRTEIDDICGAVAREAGIAETHAPLNKAMTWLVSEVLRTGETNASRL